MGRRSPLRRRCIRSIGIGAALIALLLLGAYLSGRQAPIDIVAATAERLGVPLESRMIPTNGVRLHVVLAGPPDGPPVILLHGYPEFWWGWNQQIARLARAGFRVIAPDQRGYNASEKPPGIDAYRIELLLDDVLGLIQALGYEQVYLAGHDWGGGLAWYLVLEHPERFRKLVMFNAPHPLAWEDVRKSAPQEHTISWYRTFFQLPVVPELVGRAGNWWLLAKNLRDTSRAGTFPDTDMDFYKYAWDRDGSMHAMVNWYRASFRYPHEVVGDGVVRVPTRVVWGMKDRFFESRLGRFSVTHCANASLLEIPDAGHWLLHEEPERTSNQMIEFFREP
jgi:pimeloyl-ACP methyl ester carboxylesterase